jgi:hypothetical protein
MNLNDLAKEVALLEGGKQNLSIAQIKEVIKCVGMVLAELDSLTASVLVAKLIAKGTVV